MTHCSASLSSQQRKTLRHLLAKESQIIEQCRKHCGHFSDIMMQLQCVNHHHNPEERALKCTEFIRDVKQLDQFSEDDIAVHNLDPASIQTALTCDCMCIQAACFRILYKWLPELDKLRMKRLKVITLCSDSVLAQTGAVEVCAKIEQIAQKIANDKASKTAS
jgi:hypothetical protein